MKPKALAIVGCTASGKSDLALKLAKEIGGEIVCMDSMQVYRRMDIGTAKPTPEERAEVPHHLLDVAEPAEPFAVADYAPLAERAILEIASRGRVPLLVGGTGLYLKAVMHGMTLGYVKSDPALRRRYEQEAVLPGGKQRLHQQLEAVDPETAARLHQNDLRRVIRALEIFELSGVPMSKQEKREPERPFQLLPLGLSMPREALSLRIEARVKRMLQNGLLGEVKALLESGVPPAAQAMQGIGYKELVPVLQGRLSLGAATEQITLNTRRYAKRQETWFKGEPALTWAEAGEGALAQALQIVERFINKETEE